MINLAELLKDKKAVIFDLDGTLIDSVGVWTAVDVELIARIAANGRTADEGVIVADRDAALARYRQEPEPYICYCGFLGQKYGSDLTAQEIHAIRRTISAKYLRSVVDYKPQAAGFIKKLAAMGLKLAIASTTRRNTIDVYRLENENIRRQAAIDDYFSVICTCEDVTAIKPAPDIFLLAAERLGAKPADCVIFEDSLVGIQAANAANIPAVAVYDRYAKKDAAAITAGSALQIKNYGDALKALG